MSLVGSFVQVLLDFMYGLRHRAIAALLLKAFEAGEDTIGEHGLLPHDALDILSMDLL